MKKREMLTIELSGELRKQYKKACEVKGIKMYYPLISTILKTVKSAEVERGKKLLLCNNEP